MDPRVYNGILSSAQALGMNPAELATIISYETGGTFDPTITGPTTKWGQMRGLIQFGEPQAQQYGVDWAHPVESQLGPNGAVVKYFQGHGWQPGMGVKDAYSIVNAGAPGRYNASDAAAGGAPGTVGEKVDTQFGPHAARAAALFGGAQPLTVPTPAAPAGASIAGLFAPPPAPTFDYKAIEDQRNQQDKARRQALFGGGSLSGMFA